MQQQRYQMGEDCKIYDGAMLFPNVRLGRNVTIFPGAVIGRPPLSSGATTRQLDVDELLPVHISDHCVVGCNAVIYMDVRIGEHSMVCDTACIREGCEIGNYSLIAMGVTVNYCVKIGHRVKIMDNAHITGRTTVEDDVFISTMVTTTNDNSLGRKRVSQSDWPERGPRVRRFARIGQGACLLPGIEIGENAIVGANAVVTRNVAPGTVVMGIPAREVRKVRPQEMES